MQEFFLDYCLTQELSHKKSRYTYLAHARQDAQQKFIIKIFDPECANRDQKKGLVLADALLSFKHPHIIPVVDMAIEQGLPYIVRGYCPHGSLGQRLKRLYPERMDWPDAVRIVIQIGQALSYAHERRIIHGNLKLENVFYHLDGNVQITDFSLASFVDIVRLDYQSDLSTIRYMAPEQFREKTDQQSDQYSLACLAYELITGKPPFVAMDFKSLWGKHATEYPAPLASSVPQIPMSIDLAILKALEKEPHNRYVDIVAFLAALERGLSAQVAGFSLSLVSSSSANTADQFLLSNPRDDTLFSELPIASVGMTRPLSRLSGELDPSAPDHALALSLIPDREGDEVRDSMLEPVFTPQRSMSARSESGENALLLSPRTTDALRMDSDLTRADHTVSLALDRAEQHAIAMQDQSKGANALHVVLAQTGLLQLRQHTQAYVLWIRVVLIMVVLVGILSLPVFGTPFLPLRVATMNMKQSSHNEATKTATSVVRRTQGSTPKATQQASLPLPTETFVTPIIMLKPLATPVPTPVPIPTPMPTPMPTPTPVDGSVQINAGGSSVGSYSADTDYTDGSVWSTNNTVNTSGVSNAAPESVYQTCRYGYDFTYLIPHLNPHQAYTVRLHFSAMSWTQQGQNVFDVTINGDTALGSFDINAAAGGTDIAVVKSFTEVARRDGTILMQFDADEGYVMVSGIQVLAD